jgi:Ca2+-binding EF-hand superfamily protein
MKTHHFTLGLLALALTACQTIETDRDLFVKCDTDKDGRISLDEACTMGYPRLFGRFDNDGDGRVSLSEVKVREPDFDPKLFAERDLNHDGTVTFAEYCKVADRKGAIPELFAKVDTNGDGYIDKTEAKASVAALRSVGKR